MIKLRQATIISYWTLCRPVFTLARKLPVGEPGYRHYLASLAIVAMCSFGSSINAAEIVPFRTTDIDSAIELRYQSDERTDNNASIQTFNQQQISYEEEFIIRTRNYVFHPNFLKLDLGASLIFKQNTYEANLATNKSDDNTYNLNARANFLEKKPYPISFHYTRANPTYFFGLSEPIRQKNTRYGLDLFLLEPLIPLRFELTASHDEQSGSSPTQLLDQSTDKFGIRASKVYSKNYSHRLSFDHDEKFAGSGSLALAITPTSTITDMLSYSSEWHPEGIKNIRYFDSIRISKLDGVVSNESVGFTPQLTWQHSDKAKSSYYYDYFDQNQAGLETTRHLANTEFSYQYDEQTEFQTKVIVEDFSSTSVDSQSIGADGLITYKRPITNGSLRLIGGLDYRDNEREATAAQANIIGESITLSGLTPVALTKEFIIAGSIVVQNLSRSQTYIEGIDYRVVVIGARSEIQRLSGSNIGDPEQVIVDYDYQTGGSADYSSLAWSYIAELSFNRFDLYLRHRRNDQKLSAGSPTLPLYSRNTLEFGGGTEYPLSNRIEIGANVDMVRDREGNSPSDSQRYNVYGQFILGNRSTLRLNADWVIVDNINSVEDNDQTQLSMIFRSRLRNRMMLSAEAYSEKDIGGTITRKSTDFKFTAQWRIYALTMNAEAVFGSDQTGATETERARFMVTIRRDI